MYQKEDHLALSFLAFPVSDLICSVVAAAAADSFVDITKVPKISSWAKDQQLTRKLPGFTLGLLTHSALCTEKLKLVSLTYPVRDSHCGNNVADEAPCLKE